MTDWKNPDVVLKVPRKLAQDIEALAKEEYPPKKWSDKARELLYSYVALYRARGLID